MPGIFYTITIQDIEQWPPGNYVNPPDDRKWLAPYSVFWSLMSTILISVRLMVRIQHRAGSFGWDDVFIIIAWIFAVAFTATACVATWDFHIGRHIWDVNPTEYANALYTGWLAQVMFLHSTCATKTSVLLFYYRMVKDNYNRKWLYTVWVLLFITVGSWIGIFFTYVFMCIPLHTFWTYYTLTKDMTAVCINGPDLTIAVGVLTIASDFWTAALPCALFQYNDLGVSKKQRWGLNGIFCLGFLVTGVGIARTYYLWKMSHTNDLSYYGYNLFAVSIVEIELSLICTCAPFLRALFRKYGNRMSVIGRSSANGTHGTHGTAERISIHRSGVRASFVGVTPLRQMERSPMRDAEEKSGCLVREEGTGRLVWSTKGSRASLSSPTSVIFPTEPLSPMRPTSIVWSTKGSRTSGAPSVSSPTSVSFPTEPLSPIRPSTDDVPKSPATPASAMFPTRPLSPRDAV